MKSKIVFNTKDNVLVMQRDSEIGTWDREIQESILDANAREHGVRINKTERIGDDLICTVSWL